MSQHEFKSQRRHAAIQRREAAVLGLRLNNAQLEIANHHLREQLLAWEFWWNSGGSDIPAAPGHDTVNVIAHDTSETVTDPFELLAGMATQLKKSDQFYGCSMMVGSYYPAEDFEGQSLVEQRLQTRRNAALLECRAREVWTTVESIGTLGTIEELDGKSLLVPGALLESSDYTDVYLDGFNGIRYLTAGPVLVVKATEYTGGRTIVLKDASDVPTRDQGGRAVFGEIGRRGEVFCVVGNTHLCGQELFVDDLPDG